MILKGLVLKLLRAFQSLLLIQSVCFLASLPILYFWEIPFSGISMACNIIFSPAMILFVMYSILFSIFGTVLPRIFCDIFSFNVHWWLKSMNALGAKWLLLPSHKLFLAWMVAIVCIKGASLFSKMLTRKTIIIAALGLNLIAIADRQPLPNTEITLQAKTGWITITKKDNKLEARDYGFLAAGRNSYNVLAIRKEVIKGFGTGQVDSLTLNKPSPRAIQRAATAKKLMDIEFVRPAQKSRHPKKQCPQAGPMEKFL